MEGAKVAVIFLPAEEDAQHRKAQVEKNGGDCPHFQPLEPLNQLHLRGRKDQIRIWRGRYSSKQCRYSKRKGTIFDISEYVYLPVLSTVLLTC